MGYVYGAHRARRGPPKPFKPGPNMLPASDLHSSLEGRPVIVMGSSYSLNYVDLAKIHHFKTIGCNRCLRADAHDPTHPDYYVCADRDPYAQVREQVAAFKGIRVLSKMLFDPNNLHPKKKIRTHWAPLQPMPDFPWYGLRLVSSSMPRHGNEIVYTRWKGPDAEKSLGGKVGLRPIPVFSFALDVMMAHAANVGYAMFQIAAALGANPIGIVGIDLKWESPQKSHAHGDGNGRKDGAFTLNAHHTLPFFRAGYSTCRRFGIEVYNLSPKGLLSPTIPRLSDTAFFDRFGGYADGEMLYPRKLGKPYNARPNRFSRQWRENARHKPPPGNAPPHLAGYRGRRSPSGNNDQVAARKAHTASLARSRRTKKNKGAGG